MSLIMKFRGARTKGICTWWLGRDDNANIIFPADEELQKLFSEAGREDGLLVLRRGVNNCIITTPAGISWYARRNFLLAVASQSR